MTIDVKQVREMRDRLWMDKANYELQTEAGNMLDAIALALEAPRSPMTEDEILQRAEQAYKSLAFTPMFDTPRSQVMASVAQALRDLDKPLVDPVVLACREIVANAASGPFYSAEYYRRGDGDNGTAMNTTIAAYRAGQAAGK